MKKQQRLSYENLSSSAKFREQFRLTFAGLIIATVLVVPGDDVLAAFLKTFLAIAAILSAIFLITSAAKLKYTDPVRMYEVVYLSERFRMRMFDWSLDVFGFAFLYFISLLLVGLIDDIPGVELAEWVTWILLIAIVLAVGVVMLVFGDKVKSRESEKRLPDI